MASLIQDYEQQYAVLSAEITSDIGKISRITGGKLCFANRSIIKIHMEFDVIFPKFLINPAERKELITKINSSLEEVQELVI